MIRTDWRRPRQLSMQDMPLHGSLAGIFFPRLVARLHAEEFEGTLRVSTGTILKVVYFKRGEIASAASNAEGDRLPSILIQEGRLTPPQLEMARSRVTPEKSLGKALIEMGFLTPSELLQGARRQVRQILASCFRLREGTYQIENGPLPSEVTVLGLPTRRLIFDALLEAADRAATVSEIGSMETVYRPAADRDSRLASLKLEPAMEELARRFDGRTTLRDLSGGTSLDDFTVGRTALALEILGLLERAASDIPPESEVPASRLIPIESLDAAEPPEEERPKPEGENLEPAEPWARSDAEPPDDFEPAPAEMTPAANSEERVPAREAESEPDSYEPAEMPAIPSEDLPAFARSEDEPDGWSVDQKTGEKVRFGPIEMTFDGRVGAAPESTSRLGRLVGYAVVALLAVVSALWFVSRRGAGAGGEIPVTRVVETARPPSEAPRPTPVPPGRAREEEHHAPPAEEPAPAPAPVAAASPPAAPPPGTEPDHEPQSRKEPGITAQPEPRAPVQAAVPAETTAPPPAPRETGPAATGAFGDAARAGLARQSFDAGEFADAAAKFQDLIALEPEGRVTLQLMIACETETLRTAGVRAGGAGPIFVLPVTLKDRSCYRACWGVYAGKEEALAAIGGLPPAYAGAGVKPIVVSLARLRPAP